MADKERTPEEINARLAAKNMRKGIKGVLDRWDPLSLRGLPGFENEYNDHVGPLFVLVRKGAEPMEIARHLNRLMVEEWGLQEDRETCLQVAEKVHRCGQLTP